MLSNRFTRLVATVIVDAIMLGLVALLMYGTSLECVDDFSGCAVLILALCGLHQLFGDVFAIKLFDNKFFVSIKRIVFYAAAFLLTLLFSVLFFQNLEYDVWKDLSFIERTFFVAYGWATPLAIVCCVVGNTLLDEQWIPFYAPASIVASFLVGLLFAALGETVAKFALIIGLIALVVGLIFYIKCGGKIYMTESEIEDLLYVPDSATQGGSSRSSSRGSSYSSSRSSGSSYSSSSSDNRKSDSVFFSDFSTRMHSIANYSGCTVDLPYGASMNVQVHESILLHSVEFTVSVVINIENCTAQNQGDMRDIANDRDKELQRIVNEIASDAEDVLSEMREKYTDYDGSMRINVKVGNIRVSQ